LIRAKELYFGSGPVPATQASRADYLRATAAQEEERSNKAEEIDRLFWKDPDGFQVRAAKYAELHALYSGF